MRTEMNRPRAPYGIKEPGSPPIPDPWYVRLLNLASQKSAQLAARYGAQNTSGQIVGDPHNTYSTVLQAGWHRPTQPKADPIGNVIQYPDPQSLKPWPTNPGSRWTPLNRTFRMDPRPVCVGQMRPAYLPAPEAYDRYSSANPGFAGPANPRSTPYHQDYLPVRFDTRIPARITRPHRAGLALMGGVMQHGTRQTYGQWGESIIIPPPGFTRTPSQAYRSASGVLSRKTGTGRERIPAIFTPSQVQ